MKNGTQRDIRNIERGTVMSEESWLLIRQLIDEWYEQNQVWKEKADDRIEQLCRRFEELVDFVQQGSQNVLLNQQELIIAVAILALGPTSASDPPDSIWQKLVEIGSNTLQKAHAEQYLEIVIAWGCGWGRTTQSAADKSWDGRWNSAVLALSDLMKASIRRTGELLENRLISYKNLFTLEPQAVYLYAGLLSVELIQGRCSCGNIPRGYKHNENSLNCGRDEHKLTHWDPKVCSLQAFLAQAVRGSAAQDLQVGAFGTSMLYPRLSEDSGLLTGSVEFKKCHKCSELYESNHCSVCDTSFDPSQTMRLARKNWLLLPYDRGGTYQMVERWRCRNCGNLFPARDTNTVCPICAGDRSQRPTNIWVHVSTPTSFESEAEKESK